MLVGRQVHAANLVAKNTKILCPKSSLISEKKNVKVTVTLRDKRGYSIIDTND